MSGRGALRAAIAKPVHGLGDEPWEVEIDRAIDEATDAVLTLFRRILTDALPDDPKWVVWVEGVLDRIAAGAHGIVLSREEARLLVSTLNRTDEWHAVHFAALAARLEEDAP